jgi:membrane protease YdiL (CAAX protease family)
MSPADGGGPASQSTRAGLSGVPAWAMVLAAAGLAVITILVGRWAGSSAARLIVAAMANVPPPLPGVLAAAAFRLITFGPLAAIAVGACILDGRTAWPSGRRPGWATAGGGAVGLGALMLAVGLAALAGDVAPGEAGLAGGQAAAGVVAGLALFAFQVAAEELYFRGWLQPALCARWGSGSGLIVTAVLFAGLHIAGGARAPLSLANLFLGGLMFGLLALRSGGLWAPFMAHFAWNWTEACGLGLEANPGVGPSASIFHIALHGEAPWSGGDDRLNGSLAMTLVLAALVVGLAAFGSSRSATLAARRSGSAP